MTHSHYMLTRLIGEVALWVFLFHLGYGYWWSSLPVLTVASIAVIVWETRKR